MIVKLEAGAFKGLKKVAIEPKNVNLLIGANGTGKTNFADLIEFLSLASRFGLKEAFDRRGGLGEIRTMLPGQGRPPALHCSIKLGADPYRGIEEVNYFFTLSTSKALFVADESLDATIYPRSVGRPTPPGKVNFDRSKPTKISFKRNRDKIELWNAGNLQNPESFKVPENLILNAYGKLGNFQIITDYIGSMRVYNIDATIAKEQSNGGEVELERTGSNLIPFLKRVIGNDNMRTRLLADLRNAVPYIKDIKPDKTYSYKNLIFSEEDSNLNFRAQQMSDGTVRLLGLLAVLRQPVPPPVVVIEEPENALHSYAIEMLLRICREVSVSEKFSTQIFITSHSPKVVDEVLSIESRREADTQGFVTRRQKEGYSTIKPAPPSVIQAIAKNLGRPSDFLREGDFRDAPNQPELTDGTGNTL
ncbi:MAG: AAA family ATPase [Ignavibacteria bacterium]|nr:AAA family ATPase [Ignavibacteria bacterium]MBI3765594.1 AAA family ATPase [Ignavibacteriales bacterium]